MKKMYFLIIYFIFKNYSDTNLKTIRKFNYLKSAYTYPKNAILYPKNVK